LRSVSTIARDQRNGAVFASDPGGLPVRAKMSLRGRPVPLKDATAGAIRHRTKGAMLARSNNI